MEPLAPEAVASRRYERIGDLASALTFLNGNLKSGEKIERLRGSPYALPVRPTLHFLIRAAEALVKRCWHRRQVLRLPFGTPLCNGSNHGIARREEYVEALEVRMQLVG